MSEGESNLQRRWLEAMNRITCSLISDEGLKLEQAVMICKEFSRDLPVKPTIKKVKALEFEAEQTPPIPEYIRAALEDAEPLIKTIPNSAPTPISPVVSLAHSKPKQKHRKTQLNIEDYPKPWCKVTKDGNLVRYEDNTGRVVPEIFWPSNKGE